jgi:hypothetical protein
MRIMALLLAAVAVASGGEDLTSVVQKVADVQKQLPWFWCPPLEGAADMRYTYQMMEVRERSGKQSTLQMERIPVNGGSYYRCLAQNGASPWAAEIVEALEKDSKRAAEFTPEEKARAEAARKERRARRQAFCADFPAAFRFDRTGPAEIRFTPTGKFKGKTDLVTKIRGSFSYDPETFEIVRMKYTVLGDTNEAAWRMYKGSTFSVSLELLADRHYLPARVEEFRKLPKGPPEHRTEEYANYKGLPPRARCSSAISDRSGTVEPSWDIVIQGC